MLEKGHLYVPTLCQIPPAPVHVHLGHHRSDFSTLSLHTTGLICLIVLGVVHTGVAFWLYFGALPILPAKKKA